MISIFHKDANELLDLSHIPEIRELQYPVGKTRVQFKSGKGWLSECSSYAVLNAAEAMGLDINVDAGNLYDLARELMPVPDGLKGSYTEANLEGFCQTSAHINGWTSLVDMNDDGKSESVVDGLSPTEAILVWLLQKGPVILDMKWYEGYQKSTISKVMVPNPYDMQPGWKSHSVVAVGLRKTRRFFWNRKTWHVEIESSTWTSLGKSRPTNYLPFERLAKDVMNAHALVPDK